VCVFVLYPVCQWRCFTDKKNGVTVYMLLLDNSRLFVGLWQTEGRNRLPVDFICCGGRLLYWKLCAPHEFIPGLREKEHGCRTLLKTKSKFKRINEDDSNGRHDSEMKKNRRIQKTYTVWHNSREALLPNYFFVTTKRKLNWTGDDPLSHNNIPCIKLWNTRRI
jgi:hypothetical protein